MGKRRILNLDDIVDDDLFFDDDLKESELFNVTGLWVNGRAVVRKMRMSRLSWWDDKAVAGLEAYTTAPSAEELLHTMEVSTDYLKNVIRYSRMAEWTSTFIILRGNPDPANGYSPVTVIHRPTRVHGDVKSGWVIEGGRRVETLLPPKGWYVPVNGHFWSPEGVPTITVAQREDAVETIATEFGCTEKTARHLASMLYYRDQEIEQYSVFQVARVNGKHPIGHFRFGLYPVGIEHDGAEWFKLRDVERGPFTAKKAASSDSVANFLYLPGL